MTDGRVRSGAPRWLRSLAAVLAGFVVVVVLSTAADAAMHATGVFPPADQRMEDPLLFLLALAYRGLFTLLGGCVTARLAPASPMRHALALAALGLLAGLLGIMATLASDLGPLWYAVAVAVTGPLCVLLGGWMVTRRAAQA